MINWLFIDAVYTGDSRDVAPWKGGGLLAWSSKVRQFMAGRYPLEERLARRPPRHPA
ncbi:MAG: hypothetical protein HPM95_15505 [Alphaproteobacteria bacterium]|nr:hypothetical protein [Alphaproteobacteria bacterium]